MRDSDDIRRRIEQRLLEMDLEHAVVSVEIGKNRGYLHDYLRKGTPKHMPMETKLLLAERLKIAPTALGLNTVMVQPSGLGEDATTYVPPRDFPLPLNMAMFRMKTRALDEHPKRIQPGTVLMVDLNLSDPMKIATGSIVVAQLYDRNEMTRSHGTIIRQFLAPNKLVTNSSEHNEVMSLDDPSLPIIAVIKGTLAYLMDSLIDHAAHNDDEAAIRV